MERIKNWWYELENKNQQAIKSVAIVTIAIVITYFFVLFVNNKQTNNNKLVDKSKIDLSAAKGNASIQDSWLERSELKLEELQSQIEQKDRENIKIKKQLEDLNQKIDSFFDKDQTEDLRRKVEKLERQNKFNQSKQHPQYRSQSKTAKSYNKPFAKTGKIEGNSRQNYSNQQNISDSSLQEAMNIAIGRRKGSRSNNSCKPPICLPAFSYAAGVLISAADVVTGVNSQANPKPVMIKLITEAVTGVHPVTREPILIDIKDCRVGGRIVAELSSERGNVILDKMVCYNKEGEAIHTDIEAYVADLSKHGISGKVVRREGDLVTKSFLAGMVGGIGSGLSAKFQQGLTFSDGFTTANNMRNKDIAFQGLGAGIKQSSGTVEQYLIELARQHQPTIEISAGKLIEVVFISKAYLDGRKSEKSDQTKSNQTSKANNLNNINSF